MAFLEDEDSMGAFSAALSFVEQYSIDSPVLRASLSSDTTLSPVDKFVLPSSPTFPVHHTPSHTVSDLTVSALPSPRFQLSPQSSMRLRSGDFAAASVLNNNKLVRRGRKKTTGGIKKPMTRGDPNRARNERKIELAFLREKVTQLEVELQAQKLHSRKQTIRLKDEKQHTDLKAHDCTMTAHETAQIPGTWEEVAYRQRRRREIAERENVRLKLILQDQIRMARNLESLLLKRTKQQVAKCSTFSQNKVSKYSQGRTLEFRADVNDFQDLLIHLDRAYHEVDAVFAKNGLATMEATHRDARMREGADCMYLDIFANKVMPFGMRATAKAVWDHFKGAEKHRGNMYEGKVAKHLESPNMPDTIMEDFAKEFFADNARADFHAKQVLRRYVEEDREIVIWIASVVPLEFDDQRVKGLAFRHQGYALVKRSKSSMPDQEFSLFQLCSLVSPEKENLTVCDPAAVRALTDFMLGTVAGNITASQELIENVLMDQAVNAQNL
ncbi:hypothetical protein CCR75_003849 [Bremia lactucae]|uniref:M96 mating-specific protein family n=1 Tax=Bremia lactucae TaxID=4779 RepID=A0A976NZP4_BRELC|nr:hypothetical protein CCR75_003849 [Bremia lactucae]